MYLTFSFPDGRRCDGVLLAVGRDEMRVAVQDQPDTLAFRLVDGYWTAENGERIELESLIRTGQTGLPEQVSSASSASSGAGLFGAMPQ